MSDNGTSRTSPYDSDEWREYSVRVVEEMLPKLTDSRCMAMLLSGTDPDVKMAVELGFALLLDKPLILLVTPNTAVPERLRRAADAIVVGEIQHPNTQKELAAAIKRVGVEPE